MTDEQNDIDEQWQVTCAYCADRDDEIERLRAQLAIFTPSEIKAAHERRTATDV